MKKVICKIEYDTDASELIQKKVFGVFGDPKGYEESLYKTKDGKFFVYTLLPCSFSNLIAFLSKE